MLLLSEKDVERWRKLGATAVANSSRSPAAIAKDIGEDLRAPFHYYVGSMLAAKGRMAPAKKWLAAGQRLEPFPACAYMLDLIERQGDKLAIPQVTFSDPKPWGHFSSLPELKTARDNFVRLSAESLPYFDRPFSMIDIGCGSGELGVRLIRALIENRKVTEVRTVMLMDPSPAMLELAGKNVRAAFHDAKVRFLETRLEDAGDLDDDYDVALASSSVHHMPAETKTLQLGKLGGSIDHFLLMELEANHDYPELFAPELAFSAYQIFGRALQFVFSQDAPADIQRRCADIFLMTEAVSLLSEPRGRRTEYHMLRRQWLDLLDDAMGDEFSCVRDSTCYADPYVEQMMLHYSRNV
ncbi:MAG: class I SAM-dependent methyltransferase [Candidatus Geothermincolia bacterium]